MNNSYFAVGQVLQEDAQNNSVESLKEREAKLIRIVEAIREISSSEEWSSLKSEIFDGLADRLSKDLKNESRRENPDTLKLNRITGQLIWAERYSDLNKLEVSYLSELSNIRKQLYGTTQERPGS